MTMVLSYVQSILDDVDQFQTEVSLVLSADQLCADRIRELLESNVAAKIDLPQFSELHRVRNNCVVVRPEAIAFGAGLCFTADVFFFKFFCQREISEIRRSIGAKFCTLISTRPNFIMPVQNLLGPPQKYFGAKNVQNLARFQTTLKFGGEYLRNR